MHSLPISTRIFLRRMFIATTCLGLAILIGCSSSEDSSKTSKGAAPSAESQAAPKTNFAGTQEEKFFLEGNDYSNKGQFDKAIEAYKKSISVNAGIASVHYNLGNVYVAAAKTDLAVTEYLEAIKLNPMNPEYHRNLGFAYALLQDGKMAKRKYDELRAMSPRHAEELQFWIKRANEESKTQ